MQPFSEAGSAVFGAAEKSEHDAEDHKKGEEHSDGQQRSVPDGMNFSASDVNGHQAHGKQYRAP
jgi:hypothetical protein